MAVFIDNVLGLVVLTLTCLLKLSIVLSMLEPGNYGIELF
jgi:type III secretory pathway component EscR